MKDVAELKCKFKDRFIDLIQEKGVSLLELSKQTNIPYSTLNGYTLSKRLPKVDVLCVLADFFGVTIDYLLGREN